MALVSFAVASYNSRAFLVEAVRSALAQRGAEVEVLVVDDHSADGSDSVAQALSAEDRRVRYFRTPFNSGPSGARNLALAEARGEWFAVLDSDDLIHPDRTRRLLDEAKASGADMIADDLILFDHDHVAPPTLFLDKARAEAPSWIGLADYLDETRMYGRRPNLGFLKPMIRRDFLLEHSLRYDEALRIAEDDALVVACLRAGARYRLLPQPLYHYRKHGSSTSHRLGTAPADAMKRANDRLLEELGAGTSSVASAMRRRAAAMNRAWAFTHLIHRLRVRDAGGAIKMAARHPGGLRLLHQPITARLRRLLPGDGPAMQQSHGDTALVVSKQRIAGATNGSSAYLLAIAGALRDRGLAVHLVHPSDSLFGRTPFFRLAPELSVFAGIQASGAWQVAGWLVAKSPRIWLAALRGMAGRITARLGAGAMLPDRKAPYSVATPWQREDLLFVAARAGLRPRLMLADYVFCTEAFGCLVDPAIHTAIVMHDQFSARTAQFGEKADSVAALSLVEEAALLARADAVLAIQAHEAKFVRRVAPAVRALHVPMPAQMLAAEPAAGEDDSLLFVGSDTAPNIHGLRWFLEEVWTLLSKHRPELRLIVAGSVRNAFGSVPPGVELLGIVPDLEPLYHRAGIVISPLLQGSGLKIKLVDAMARGKACVVTSVTLQGVEHFSERRLVLADKAPAFAEAILKLAGNRSLREQLGRAALGAARAEFGPAKAFAELNGWLDECHLGAAPSRN